jgi:hypothetical protein
MASGQYVIAQVVNAKWDSQSQSYFMTDSQSVSMSWYRAPLWDLRYYFLSECYCLKFAVLFMWDALSDERTGL